MEEVPVFTQKQSQARVRELRARGCKVQTRVLRDGTRVVLKKCPDTELAENPNGIAPVLVIGGLAALAWGLFYVLIKEAKAAPAKQNFFVEPQTFELQPARSRFFTAELTPQQTVEVEFFSTLPIDVFFVDSAQLAAMERGEPFEHRGQLALKSGVQSFQPPESGSWTLIVGNPSTEQATNITIKATYR